MSQWAGGNLNLSIAESPARPTSRWLTGASGLTTSTGPPEQAGPGVSRGLVSTRAHWLLDPNFILDAFAGSGSYIARGSYTRLSTIWQDLDVDIIGAAEGRPSTLLRQTTLPLVSTTSRSGLLYDERESLLPFLALVQSALERDDFDTARKALGAIPLDITGKPEVRRLKTLLAPPRITVSRSLDVDRTQEYQWLRNHWQNYRGQWVALEGDSVLASARSLRELREALKALELARPPLVHRVD